MMNLHFQLIYDVRADRWRVIAESGAYREARAIAELPDAVTRMMVDVATSIAQAAKGMKMERLPVEAQAAGNKPKQDDEWLQSATREDRAD